DVQTRVTDVVLGKEKPVEESDPEYEKLKQYIFELEEHLAEAQKQAFLLVKKHKAFSDFGIKAEIYSYKLQNEADNVLMNFEEPLKDYVRAVQSIKATMADRANAFSQQCELTETAKLKEINL
ncbi:Sorting nexin 1, partial [Nymphaea thermarum]